MKNAKHSPLSTDEISAEQTENLVAIRPVEPLPAGAAESLGILNPPSDKAVGFMSQIVAGVAAHIEQKQKEARDKLQTMVEAGAAAGVSGPAMQAAADLYGYIVHCEERIAELDQ